MVMQIPVQIGDTSRIFFMNPPGSVEDLKNYISREIPKTRFMGFDLLYEIDKGEYVVLNDVRMADIRLASPRLFTCSFTLARIACPLHFYVKASRFHYSIWATPKQ